MPKVVEVSEADIEAYERDGVVCLRGVFSPDWIVLMQDAVEQGMAGPGPFADDGGDLGDGEVAHQSKQDDIALVG